jgi:hypothetical protein
MANASIQVGTFTIYQLGLEWFAEDHCNFNDWGQSGPFASLQEASDWAWRAHQFKLGKRQTV